jgi:zinc protease
VLERAVDLELERLAREPVSAVELARAHSILISTEAYENETVTDLAEALGEWAADGDWRLALSFNEKIRAVDARRVREIVQRLLVRERRVVGWCHPAAPARRRASRRPAPRARPGKKRARPA